MRPGVKHKWDILMKDVSWWTGSQEVLTHVNTTVKTLSVIERECDCPTHMVTGILFSQRRILNLELGVQSVFDCGLSTVTVTGRNFICLLAMAWFVDRR